MSQEYPPSQPDGVPNESEPASTPPVAAEPASNEPTQPLAGWQPSQPQSGSGAYQQPVGNSPNLAAPAQHKRPGLPVGAWVGIAALALVLGLIGGIAGAGLLSLADRGIGRVSSGLNGVRTQEAVPLDAENGSEAAVAQALLPSTVQIVADHDGQRSGATGSGFVLDREGHVVTNNHVVASAAAEDGKITVIDHAGRRHEASVVGRSPVYDLALLLVADLSDAEPAALGASRPLLVGEPVVAFGAPLGLSQTVTAGIVSALDRPVTTAGESADETSFINAIQTDAAINPGNSGGPLVNLAGEVVGVNSAIATTGGLGGEAGNIGVGFAIPIEQVRTTVDQILRTGKAQYPVIGATVRTGGDGIGVGAEITEVMSGTPAERAGLKKGDVVTAVGDQPVSDGIALIVAIRTHRPGDEVEFTVRRGEEELRMRLRLDGEVG